MSLDNEWVLVSTLENFEAKKCKLEVSRSH